MSKKQYRQNYYVILLAKSKLTVLSKINLILLFISTKFLLV